MPKRKPRAVTVFTSGPLKTKRGIPLDKLLVAHATAAWAARKNLG